MGLWNSHLNFPNVPFDFARCAAPGSRARGISRDANPIRYYMIFTIWPYMSSIRIGPPAVAAELFALAHGMARAWEIIPRSISLWRYVVIYRGRIARAGPGFLFPPRAPGIIFKNKKTWDILRWGVVGGTAIGLRGRLYLSKGTALGLPAQGQVSR